MEVTCVHHWVIDLALYGVCKLCGQERQFADVERQYTVRLIERDLAAENMRRKWLRTNREWDW